MRTPLLIAAISIALISQAALAQDSATSDTATSMRGIRIEGDIGGDRFQSQGAHNDKLGYGATLGFDGVIGQHIVIGPEGTYWRASDWTENCTAAPGNASVCHKSFEEWGVGVRVGYLLNSRTLIYGKGGYVANEQRKRYTAPIAANSYYDHFNSNGYQVGGGAEYTVTEGRFPAFVNLQYVFSQYNDHTSRHRLMAGVGIRFK
jgi:outer membrane immunogenic protein